jgi:transposase
MVREIGNLAKVARDVDLTESALRTWVQRAEIDEGRGPEGALTTEKREELRPLRRERARATSSRATTSCVSPGS